MAITNINVSPRISISIISPRGKLNKKQLKYLLSHLCRPNLKLHFLNTKSKTKPFDNLTNF
jgi:hypothetical protein